MARKRKIVEGLSVVDVADRGKSIAKDAEGKVYILNEGVPGDVVDIQVRKKKKSYYEGFVLNYSAYSDIRVTPKCDHFGVCGGCKWQHMGYQDQLAFKEKTVTNAVTRLAGFDATIVEPILGSEEIYYYRNKLEYSFSSKRWLTAEEIQTEETIDRGPAVGFHRPGTFDKIVDVHQCFLQEDRSDAIRNFFRAYSIEHKITFYDPRAHTGYFRNIIVRNTTLGDWMLIISVGYDDHDILDPLLEKIIEQFPWITSLYYVINTKKNDTLYDLEMVCHHGKPYIVEALGDIKYKIGPKSFFQTNTRQAVKLYDIVAEMAALDGTQNVYDLYTGLGSIALYVADKSKSVVGIEEVAPAIEDAKENARYNEITNATFLVGDVKDVLDEAFAEKYGKPDLVITDPPRAGMHGDVVDTLLELEAPRIVYVSCNPATQARDLKLLGEKYAVEKIKPVDMFPHTHHIESVALLILK